MALFGGGSLPLGAVEELSPYIESVTLALDDIVVMASDGVCDCFESGEMERLVEKADTLNPQTLSRTVLDEALKKLGGVQPTKKPLFGQVNDKGGDALESVLSLLYGDLIAGDDICYIQNV